MLKFFCVMDKALTGELSCLVTGLVGFFNPAYIVDWVSIYIFFFWMLNDDIVRNSTVSNELTWICVQIYPCYKCTCRKISLI